MPYKMFWIKKRKKRGTSVTKHYLVHKEPARQMVHARIAYWNQFYGLEFKRVAIRNQRRCWGSCTSLKNLNFSYKLLFLPEHLQDYIVVHELCHLQELNHGENFWALVAQQVPNYKAHIVELRAIEKGGLSYVRLEKLKESEYL
jgi:predicted metal-dependent hydrolase